MPKSNNPPNFDPEVAKAGVARLFLSQRNIFAFVGIVAIGLIFWFGIENSVPLEVLITAAGSVVSIVVALIGSKTATGMKTASEMPDLPSLLREHGPGLIDFITNFNKSTEPPPAEKAAPEPGPEAEPDA